MVCWFDPTVLLKPGSGQLRFALREAGSLELYGLEKKNSGIL